MKFLFSCSWAFVVLSQLVSGQDQECGNAASYLQSFDRYELTYFDGRGLAEVPRTLMATSGRFPGHGFTDVRLGSEEFQRLKESGDLAKNMNRAPVLNHNGVVIGQSKTIARYLAEQFGMAGGNSEDAAHIDAICEHIADIQGAWQKLKPSGDMSEAEVSSARAVWFDTPPSPVIEGQKERQLQWFLEKMDSSLPGDGYSVGGRPSLADAYLFNLLGETAPELGANGEPFGSLEHTKRALGMFPKTRAVVDTFKGSPGMAQYLATRGIMGF